MPPGTAGGSEAAALGPVARMMMSVAAHAVTSYVQFRALAEVLVEKGLITREELEQRYEQRRELALDRTLDEWFEPDIAYHLKMALKSSEAGAAQGSASSGDEGTGGEGVGDGADGASGQAG